MSTSDPAANPPSPAPESSSTPALRTVTAVVQVESPHVVRYRIFVRRPADAAFSEAGSGTDPGARHPLGELPAQSEVGASFNIAGTPNTAYRIRFVVEVDGTPLPAAPITGTTDANGAEARRTTVSIP
jgi:hypothetical protein